MSESKVMSAAQFERPSRELSLQIPSDAEVDNILNPPTPVLLVPCLKGKMFYEGGTVHCRGLWAMSEQAHSQPSQCSDFEFKLIKADDDGVGSFPINGRYQGWFQLKQPPPQKGSVRIEDKEIVLTFVEYTSTDDEPEEKSLVITHHVTGHGTNKFGSFNLHGTLDEEGGIQIFREYFNLTPTPGSNSAKKKSATTPSASATPAVSSARKSAAGRPSLSSQSFDRIEEPTPRSRKQQQPSDEVVPSKHSSKQATKQPAHILAAPTPTGGGDRSHRITGVMRRCLELLKELVKHPQAVWFLEPVDPIKLGIPEYPQIITNPMDFKTIRTYIETGRIETAESFAEHVRLVFRNATTFNQMKEAAVHIAALEMSGRFEDKFRVLLQTQTGLDFRSKSDDPLSKASGGGGQSSKKSKTAPKLAVGAGLSYKYAKPMPPGPRQNIAAAFMPPSIDPGALTILEMQRQMELMKQELKSLRAQVKETEITQRVNETKEAAQNPLTLDEKHALLAKLNDLLGLPHYFDQVKEILEAALPDSTIEDMEDLSLDLLDTFTQRKLQKFVEGINLIESKKKRPAPSNGTGRGDESVRKKKAKTGPGKESSSGKVSRNSQKASSFVRPAPIESPDVGGNGFSLDDSLLNDDSAELLFSHEEEDFSDFEMDIANIKSKMQPSSSSKESKQVQFAPSTASAAETADRMDEELEDLITDNNPASDSNPAAALSQSIVIGNTSAWATATTTAATATSAGGPSADSDDEDEDNVWKHAADELRTKKQQSSDARLF